MITSSNYKSVEIDILTYRKRNITRTMNETNNGKGNCKNNHNKFICSICLNKKPSKDDNRNVECCKRKSKSCPICDRSCFQTSDDDNNIYDKNIKNNNNMQEIKDNAVKNVQTSQPDVTQGLSLLNEVLTVFQNKKQSNKNVSKKVTIYKDVSVTTDLGVYRPKLAISKVFHCSIDETQSQHNSFVIVNSQPEVQKASQFSIVLKKHKSSSIPQMKLEELRNSLKEKTKSKDAVEEVNRMFATVRKCETKDDANRPMIRSGPRILPVVKTPNDCDDKKPLVSCRYCQTNCRMSSGDTVEYCHKYDACENCAHVSCCHFQKRLDSGPTCSSCRRVCDKNVQ